VNLPEKVFRPLHGRKKESNPKEKERFGETELLFLPGKKKEYVPLRGGKKGPPPYGQKR